MRSFLPLPLASAEDGGFGGLAPRRLSSGGVPVCQQCGVSGPQKPLAWCAGLGADLGAGADELPPLIAQTCAISLIAYKSIPSILHAYERG